MLKVRTLGPGQYEIYGRVEGNRIRKRISSRDRRSVEEQASELERSIRKEAVFGSEAVVTFHYAAMKYVENGGEAQFLPPIMEYFRKFKTIGLINPGQVREAALKIYPGAAPATQNRQVITPTSAVINFAHQHGWCGPIRVKRFAVKKTERPYATIEWIDAFREAAADRPRIRCLASFMFATGARIGEATKLKPNDVNWETGEALLRDTKNGEDRTTWIPSTLLAEIRRLVPRHGLVFGYADSRSHRKAWDAVIEAAGIKRLTAHEAGRHAFGRLARQITADVVEGARAGGWKSVDLYAETYSHPENRSREIADQLGNIWSSRAPSVKIINKK